MSDNAHVLLITLNIRKKRVIQKEKEERIRQVENDFGDYLPNQAGELRPIGSRTLGAVLFSSSISRLRIRSWIFN